jgi:predicted anti-sigma-YlaC factor YlaD
MSSHVIEWLNAYIDGELKGMRLRQVEEHLAECEACQSELDSLQGLSSLLQEVPEAEFTPNEKFVSQVNLRLPQRQVRSMRSKAVEVGWWLIPIGLLTAWIFFSTAVLVSDMVSAANNFGLLDNASALLGSDSTNNAVWTSTLGQFGVLQGDSLLWAERTESYTRNVLPQFIWQVSIALLYLAWIAIWWARHTRQGQVPLLEG